MSLPSTHEVRTATVDDGQKLVRLWQLLFATADEQSWTAHALDWVARAVGDPASACLPLVEVDGEIVATAVGTVELGMPNPYCPRGRSVRLANVVTDPGHRGRGYATRLVREVVRWAQTIEADRVDLSATPEARRLYERAGFVPTSAPRMKLVLAGG